MSAEARLVELHDALALPVLRYCRSRLRSREDAEDAAQVVFLNAYRSLVAGAEPQSDSAWIFKIAERAVLERARSLRRRERVEFAADLAEHEARSPDETSAVIDRKRLTDCLQMLPEQQQRALLLHELQGLEYAAIAAELGVSTGSVAWLIRRARRTVGDALGRTPSRAHGSAAWLASACAWSRGALGAAGAGHAAATAVSITVLAVAAAPHAAPHGAPPGAAPTIASSGVAPSASPLPAGPVDRRADSVPRARAPRTARRHAAQLPHALAVSVAPAPPAAPADEPEPDAGHESPAAADGSAAPPAAEPARPPATEQPQGTPPAAVDPPELATAEPHTHPDPGAVAEDHRAVPDAIRTPGDPGPPAGPPPAAPLPETGRSAHAVDPELPAGPS